MTLLLADRDQPSGGERGDGGPCAQSQHVADNTGFNYHHNEWRRGCQCPPLSIDKPTATPRP
eukprot:624428-Pyramimonas_sp.AAC.1